MIEDRTKNQRQTDRVAFAWQIAGLVYVLAYSAYLHPWPSRAALGPAAVGALLSGGILFVGIVVGLLFGIPKSGAGMGGSHAGAKQQPRFVPNTNLEQIADWLTKILVGVGLTQIDTIGSGLWRFAGHFSPVLGSENEARAFVISIVIYFTSCGFMSGYFWARMFLGRAFAAAESHLDEAPERRDDDLASEKPEKSEPAERPSDPAAG